MLAMLSVRNGAIRTPDRPPAYLVPPHDLYPMASLPLLQN
jgi:hypothetical protein